MGKRKGKFIGEGIGEKGGKGKIGQRRGGEKKGIGRGDGKGERGRLRKRKGKEKRD